MLAISNQVVLFDNFHQDVDEVLHAIPPNIVCLGLQLTDDGQDSVHLQVFALFTVRTSLGSVQTQQHLHRVGHGNQAAVLQQPPEYLWALVHPLHQLFEFEVQQAIGDSEEVASRQHKRLPLVEQTVQVVEVSAVLWMRRALLEEAIQYADGLGFDHFDRRQRILELALLRIGVLGRLDDEIDQLPDEIGGVR